MLKNTPIVIVEDDKDDQELMQAILNDLKVNYEVIFFDLCEDAFHYLRTTTDIPFIIFCDINIPKQDGFDFKKQIDDDKHLRQKSIPFVFYTTTSDAAAIDIAYTRLTIQGFFVKPANYHKAKQLVKLILDYWQHCRHPNM